MPDLRHLRRILPGFVLIAGLSLPVDARAADNTTVGVGTGAVAGALVGGPIGAVVGAIAGGVIGANSASARPHFYRRARYAPRRRAAARQAPPRARLAQRVERSEPVRRPASEIETGNRPETTGSTAPAARQGWQDPR